ncbi:RNA methyltransferase [bacterium]|jgi:RNA methyltransferase, TrmH family|nr:RNA methyltransferase [bacterium]
MKRIKKLLESSHARSKSDHYILEHPKSLLHLCQTQPDQVSKIYYREDIDPTIRDQIPTSIRQEEVSKQHFQTLKTVKTSQGLIGLCNKNWTTITTSPTGSIALLDGIQDPSNVGAIIRSAVAFNVQAIVLTSTCADPYHPAAIRSAAGLTTHIDLIKWTDAIPTWLAAIPTYALSPHAKKTTNTLSKEVACIILGGEGNGISQETLTSLQVTNIRIPMSAKAESLNVAVTAGIIFSQLVS